MITDIEADIAAVREQFEHPGKSGNRHSGSGLTAGYGQPFQTMLLPGNRIKADDRVTVGRACRFSTASQTVIAVFPVQPHTSRRAVTAPAGLPGKTTARCRDSGPFSGRSHRASTGATRRLKAGSPARMTISKFGCRTCPSPDGRTQLVRSRMRDARLFPRRGFPHGVILATKASASAVDAAWLLIRCRRSCPG